MYISICLAVLTLWYGTGFIYMTRKKGLDPSLVTYICPLQFKQFWIGRFALASTFILAVMGSSLAEPFALMIAAFALTHVALLAVFERTATQPAPYFIAFALSVIPVFLGLPILMLLAVIAQEIILAWWNRTQTKRYRNWVAQQTHAIHQKYYAHTSTLSAREWFFVLHFAVTENIARPKVVRVAEHAYFYLKKPAAISTGIMQIAAPRPMTDKESMQRGSELIQNALRALPKNITEPNEQLKWLAQAYNGSTTYSKYLYATYPGVREAWKKIEPAL